MKSLFLFSILFVFITSCGTNSNNANPTSQILNENMRKWAAAGISNYQFTYEKSCFCGPPETDEVLITVLDDVIDTVMKTSDNSLVDPSLHPRFHRVGDLFLEIQNAINKQAARLSVSYDENLGYPTLINIDFSLSIADEELTIRTRNLFQL